MDDLKEKIPCLLLIFDEKITTVDLKVSTLVFLTEIYFCEFIFWPHREKQINL